MLVPVRLLTLGPTTTVPFAPLLLLPPATPPLAKLLVLLRSSPRVKALPIDLNSPSSFVIAYVGSLGLPAPGGNGGGAVCFPCGAGCDDIISAREPDRGSGAN